MLKNKNRPLGKNTQKNEEINIPRHNPGVGLGNKTPMHIPTIAAIVIVTQRAM